MATNPLHQFDSFLILNRIGIDEPILSSFLLILGFLVAQQGVGLYLLEGSLLSNPYSFFSALILFIKFNLKSHIKLNKQIFTLILFAAFEIVLILNINGLAPLSFAVSSHITVTLFLSLGFFIGINLLGYVVHKDFLLLLFLPKNTPLCILLLVVPIEVVSYIMRIFSLAIRLFTNILAGHSLLKALGGFIYQKILCSQGIAPLFIPLVLSVATIIIGLLDIFISFLQAYIFFTLLTIYLSHVISLH